MKNSSPSTSGFPRSFAKIRAEDISREVDAAYDAEHFWPAPLIQLNPNFEPGGYIDDLVADGTLDAECAKVFRLKRGDNTFGERLLLHRHQTDAIEIAKRTESYVLTTGTGSGKSLAYFIPIVDDVLRRKRAGDACKGITAIVVYPMNALCNSQREELEKYLRLGYGENGEPVTFARYTGQESQDERERIAKNPPDILLTNYVMLELVMTRFHETDKATRNGSRRPRPVLPNPPRHRRAELPARPRKGNLKRLTAGSKPTTCRVDNSPSTTPTK